MSYPETNFNDKKKRLFYCQHQKKASDPCQKCQEAWKRERKARNDRPIFVNSSEFVCKMCSHKPDEPLVSYGDNGLFGEFREKWIIADGIFLNDEDKPIDQDSLNVDNWPKSNKIVHKNCANKGKNHQPNPTTDNFSTYPPNQNSHFPNPQGNKNDKTFIIILLVAIVILLATIIYLIYKKNK